MKDIFWIKGNPPAPLAIVLCPHGDALLEEELLRLKGSGIQTLVSLLEHWEAGVLGLANEGPAAVHIGLNFISYHFPYTRVPIDMASFRNFVTGLADRLRAGESVGIHCRGSVGRSALVAACTLIHLGWQPEAALDAIEAARGVPVPDTREQADWILSYSAQAVINPGIMCPANLHPPAIALCRRSR
jgi:protein-tyrosine phosphatase